MIIAIEKFLNFHRLELLLHPEKSMKSHFLNNFFYSNERIKLIKFKKTVCETTILTNENMTNTKIHWFLMSAFWLQVAEVVGDERPCLDPCLMSVLLMRNFIRRLT